MQALQLKISDSHLTCKVVNKCLNVRERVEVVEWNKRRSPPFPCCPVSRQCPWKKTLIEKKQKTKIKKIKTSYTNHIHQWRCQGAFLYYKMWFFASFGAICTILKTWKTPMENVTFSKVADFSYIWLFRTFVSSFPCCDRFECLW